MDKTMGKTINKQNSSSKEQLIEMLNESVRNHKDTYEKLVDVTMERNKLIEELNHYNTAYKDKEIQYVKLLDKLQGIVDGS